jgi:hypothetical protein
MITMLETQHASGIDRILRRIARFAMMPIANMPLKKHNIGKLPVAEIANELRRFSCMANSIMLLKNIF